MRWQDVFRNGFAPHISTEGLLALRGALERDDARLLQGATTSPPPLACVQDWPCEGACPIGWCAWQGGEKSVAEVEEYFADLCFKADQTLDEPAGCRHFLNVWDETPRDEMRLALLAEVDAILEERHVQAC